MIDPVTGVPQYIEQVEESNKTQGEVGRDEFLVLFLAQLKHQDPLNPMDSTQFSSQLAQFSSLEQLFNVNENLESMQALQDGTSYYQALQLMGREIEATGNIMYNDPVDGGMGGFSIPDNAYCSVTIYDENGGFVNELILGFVGAGDNTFEWNGMTESGYLSGEGLYSFEVTAISEYGLQLPVESRIRGEVDRVNMDGETPIVYVGDIPLSLSQIMDIRMVDEGDDLID